MRKIFLIIGCVVLAAGLFALDFWQGYRNGLVSEQLKQDNAEIQQLLNEKSQLEKQTEGNTQPGTAEEEPVTPKAVLCFHSLDEDFYTEIYPDVKEKADSGILVLEDGRLPGDNNYISTEDFSELMENGWDYAISLERAADDSQWQKNIADYLDALSVRVAAKPTAYYLPSGSCSEDDAQILKTLGFDTVLCQEGTTDKTVGELNVVQLLGYNDTAAVDDISAGDGYYGLEIWIDGDTSTLASVRYTEAALQDLLDNDAVIFKGLDDLFNETEASASTPANRISEIDQRVKELYH